MGIGDFLDGLGNAIDKINKYTSFAPAGMDPKPVIQISGSGVQVNTPFSGGGVGTAGDVTNGISSPVNFSVEQTLHGLAWLRDNGISQPIATAALVGKQNRGNNDFFGGDYFNSQAWTRSWKAANHISPGQALAMNPEEAEKAITSPLLYYKPPDSSLPPNFDELPQEQQQQILRDAGMPAVGNAFVDKMRGNSAWYKYGTGSLDFASAVFLDPTVLAGKAAGAVRGAAVVKKAPAGGWSEARIDQLMANSKVTHLMNGIWANRDNPQLLNNTALAQHSGMGPRFGAIVSQLRDPEELDLFVRTGMGDMRAMDELGSRNAAIRERLAGVTARTRALDLMRSRYAGQPTMQRLVDVELNRIGQAKAADLTMAQRYDEILRQADTLDQLHVSRWSMVRAEERTAAQNQYTAGPARRSMGPSSLANPSGRAVTITPTLGPLTYTRAGVRTPIDSGYVHTRLWGAGDFFTTPVTLIRSLKNYHPNGYIRLDTLDKDSLVELRGHLARIPGIKESTRQNMINAYTKAATETERKTILDDIGRVGVAKVAERYGVDSDLAMEIYRKHLQLKQGELDNMQRYSAGRRSPEDVAAMRQEQGLEQVPYETDPLAHIDTFVDTSGAIKLSPFTVTRLMNGHTFQDLDVLGKALRRHGDKLKTLRQASGNARDAVESWADYATGLWKFTTLFRLGYIPRVLSDDIAGQWAAAGSAAMTLRTVQGIKNSFDNAARRLAKPALQAREGNALAGADYAREEMLLMQPQIKGLERHIAGVEASNESEMVRAFQRHQRAQAQTAGLDPADLSPKAHAMRTFATQREQQLRQAEARMAAGASPGKKAALQRLNDRRALLGRYEALQRRAAEDYQAQYQKVIQGNQAVEIDGQIFPAAFEGVGGQYAHAVISADESVGNLFNTNKQLLQGNLERSFDHGAKPVSALQDPQAHLSAWAHAINNQIMQDQLSTLAVKGASVDDMVNWLKNTPQGAKYRARMPKMITEEDMAQSAKYEVDQYLHTPLLRMKALEPDGVNEAWLEKAFPTVADRPDVHIGQVGQSQLEHAGVLSRIQQKWFRVAATIPANRMSRHPLFNQFYEGHLKRIVSQRAKQGYEGPHTVGQINQMTESARALALRDTRSLVFDIAHRSDAAAALKFMSPFFSATTESFQRWGRIIADKPQAVGYAGLWYNMPQGNGALQDQDGNTVDRYGFRYVPTYPLKPDGTPDYTKKPTVKKEMVPKSERYIVTRVPKWVAESPLGKAFNITEAGGQLRLSQNSMNLVTQGDPWFNPGVGPIVQIPVNEYVQDKPRAAEVARQLGILPFGPERGGAFGSNPIGRAITAASPKMVKDFMTSFDTSDQRYQQVKLQIMQREIFEFEQKHGRSMNSKEYASMAERVSNKTRNYWLFSASSAFLQPMATQRKDPYQFYRDQYNGLRRQNPLTADDEFLNRYGESYFIFAQEISQSQGIPPTMKAVDLQRKYASLIAANPEMAALIIGPEGNGPFSPEAYTYELNNPLTPGGAEMMRSKMNADQAMLENQRRLGWAKYTKKMNELTAQLHAQGFKAFTDEGAEDFAQQKKNWTSLYAEPLYPDGSENPYYNEEWSKDFFTFDARKYDRMIPGLTELANSELSKRPERTDLRTLQQYLGGRKALKQALDARKQAGDPATLAAQANEDLRFQWVTFVDSLVESDTRFGDLYHRYLARDMDIDLEQEKGAEE